MGAPRDSRHPRARQPLRSLGASITSPVSILRRVTIGGHYTFHPGTAGIAELSNGGKGWGESGGGICAAHGTEGTEARTSVRGRGLPPFRLSLFFFPPWRGGGGGAFCCFPASGKRLGGMENGVARPLRGEFLRKSRRQLALIAFPTESLLPLPSPQLVLVCVRESGRAKLWGWPEYNARCNSSTKVPFALTSLSLSGKRPKALYVP